MLVFVLRRLLIAVPTLILMTLVLFLMIKAIPGDSALLLLGDKASPEALAAIRADLGLDKPIITQYLVFLKKLVLDLDLGNSVTTGEPVFQIIREKFPATIELASLAIIFAIFIGIPVGLVAAIKPGSILDFSSMTAAIMGVSMPVFWLGLILMWIFGIELEWFPISSRLGIDYYYEPTTHFLLYDSLFVEKDVDMFSDAIRHLILPALTLATIPMAFLARITRSSMLEVLNQDYIRTAKAKGVKTWKIVSLHALKNASIPITTVTGIQFGTLLGGAIITETIFAWPGIGTWILSSVNARDIPAIEGGVLVVATSFILINLLVDLIYSVLDPRMRMS